MKWFPLMLIGLLIAAAGSAVADAQNAAYVKPSSSSIGYSSVAEAMKALHSNAAVQFSASKDGWTNAGDYARNTIWSFAPANQPAYPSVVKRVVHEGNGTRRIEMNVLCESTKVACDQLTEEFEARNDRFLKSLAQFYRENPETDPGRSADHAQQSVPHPAQ
jgi:hypothetical protein